MAKMVEREKPKELTPQEKFNGFLEHMIKAKELWIELNMETELMGSNELANALNVESQGPFSILRNVQFEWMLEMLGNYSRTQGGINELFKKVKGES